MIGTGGTAIYAGAAEIWLSANVSATYVNDPRNALLEARNNLGAFVQALAATQGTGDLACLNAIETVIAPQFDAPADGDDASKRFTRWQALVKVTWGLEG